MPIKHILSIDGGGIRGIVPARVLEHLEGLVAEKAGRPIPYRTIFDLIAGTSTGGIIATGLCRPGTPMTAAQLLALYRDHGGAIFDLGTFEKWVPGSALFEPKYSPRTLEKQLSTALGDAWLSDIEPGCDLLVTSYDIERSDPVLFKSWRARGDDLRPGQSASEYDFRLWEVARATSAAPTYFPPAQIRNRHMQGQQDVYSLVDGGVFANNPAMCAYAEVRRRFPDADVCIVAIGTGRKDQPIPYSEASGWGIAGWAQPVISVMFDGVSDSVDYQLAELLPRGNFSRFQIDLGAPLPDGTRVNNAMDDASATNIKRLIELADLLIENAADELDALAARLVAATVAPA